MARVYDDDEPRRGGFFRFLTGAVIGLLFSAVVVVVLSNYVLPPPVIPEPEVDSGEPTVVDGIEVSDAPAYTGTEQSSQAGPAPEPPKQLDGPAMVVNSVPFQGDLQSPLVAVVIDDTAAQPLLHELLFSLDLPVTVGVVAGGGGDLETATAAREAGFEVVAQFEVAPPGASDGSGLEYRLPEADAALRTLTLIQRMSMAVAVSRTLASPEPLDGEVLRGLASVVGPLGYAYLDLGVAPGAESSAVTSGDAAAEGALVEVSRFTIPATATAAEAHAVLDQASAAAAEAGSAVVIAAPGEPLFQALLLWGGESEGALARLAPLTAVIRKQIGRQ